MQEASREKGDPGKDFSAKIEEAARLTSKFLQAIPAAKLNLAKASGSLKEICNEKEGR